MDSIRSAPTTIIGWLAWLPNWVVSIFILAPAAGIAYSRHKYVR
jgi:hypothetical protein